MNWMIWLSIAAWLVTFGLFVYALMKTAKRSDEITIEDYRDWLRKIRSDGGQDD